jgi:hypothetical protein
MIPTYLMEANQRKGSGNFLIGGHQLRRGYCALLYVGHALAAREGGFRVPCPRVRPLVKESRGWLILHRALWGFFAHACVDHVPRLMAEGNYRRVLEVFLAADTAMPRFR